mgnify:CR=1 FL=1
MLNLVVVDASGRRSVSVPSGPFTIGRSSDTQLQLNDPHVSRRHSELLQDGSSWKVRDLGSRGGTFVNETLNSGYTDPLLEMLSRHKEFHLDLLEFRDAGYGSRTRFEEITYPLRTPALWVLGMGALPWLIWRTWRRKSVDLLGWREQALPVGWLLLTLLGWWASETLMRTGTVNDPGYIVVDETEALVAIDVNTGRHKSGKDQDQTILRVNLEAAEEICRQLRLRNMGGLIVLDFYVLLSLVVGVRISFLVLHYLILGICVFLAAYSIFSPLTQLLESLP